MTWSGTAPEALLDPEPPPPAQVLLVANTYPSDSALYRNAFIHRRVVGYRAAGISVEVFVLHPPVQTSYEYQFDGVAVTVGNAEAYAARIAARTYRTVLVHFASPAMLDPIRRLRPRTPVVVWVHGFEAEAWHRRWFNFTDSAGQIREAVAKRHTHYEDQLAFMGWLLSTDELDIRVVHVSEWFRTHIVEPDARTATRNPVVIPNIVDGDLFPYIEKAEDDRLRILSIRPFASHKYANDLTVAAIMELSRRPYFPRLTFTLRGDGPLFEATVEPVRRFDNVSVEKGFLRQEEIAALHRQHGVFLAPTRFDSQGVSMGEAMASGLVPVSTRVAAVPEFVQDRVSGLLAEPEDAHGLAEQVEMLLYDTEMFLSLSQQAGASARQQCGFDATVGREIVMIGADT